MNNTEQLQVLNTLLEWQGYKEITWQEAVAKTPSRDVYWINLESSITKMMPDDSEFSCVIYNPFSDMVQLQELIVYFLNKDYRFGLEGFFDTELHNCYEVTIWHRTWDLFEDRKIGMVCIGRSPDYAEAVLKAMSAVVRRETANGKDAV